MKFIKKHKVITVIIILVLLVVLRCIFFTSTATDLLETAVVKRGNIESVLKTSGVIETESENISAEANGKVIVDKVTIGAEVTKGDLLYKIDSTEVLNEIKDLKHTIEVLQGEYDVLKTQYSNSNVFFDNNTLVTEIDTKVKSSIKEGDILAKGLNTDKLQLVVDVTDTTGLYVRKPISVSVGENSLAGSISSIEENIMGDTSVTIIFDKVNEEKEGDLGTVNINGTDYSSNLAYYEEVVIVSTISGKVSSLNYKVGDYVNSSSILLSINQDKSELNEKEYELNNKKNSLKELQASLKSYTVYATVSGTITEKNVSLYNKYEGTVMCVITNENVFKTVMYISEEDIESVKVGQSVTISSDNWGDSTISGEVRSISYKPSTEHAGNNESYYPVSITIDDTSLSIFEGLHVNLKLVTASKYNVLMVSSDAILADNKVEKVTDNGIEEVGVTLGISDNENVEIISGLNEGDKVSITSIIYYGDEEVDE